MEMLKIVFCISLLIAGTGMIVKWLEHRSLTEPMIAMVAAVILGPEIFGVLDLGPDKEAHNILITACKFTIAMALMTTALRITPRFFQNNLSSQSLLIGGGMILMWISSGVVLYLLLERPFTECLLLGAIISPTDPVVAATIITGETAEKYLPLALRDTLSFESGSNDGLAFPIVALSLMFFDSKPVHWTEWVTQSVLFETIGAVLVALILGYLAGQGLHRAHKAGIMNKTSLISSSVALAFLLLAGLETAGMNGILGVFAGGIAFTSQLAKNEDLMQEPIQETMERFFTVPVFFLFGLILPWSEWATLGWNVLWISLGILFFRRIPGFLLMTPFIKQFRNKYKDMLLMGWFGPIGVAALFYALHVQERTGSEDAWIITSLVVFASTLAHSLTSLPLEKWYGNDK